MGAPFGNRNAAKALEWRQALVRALKTYEDDQVKRGRALYHIARELVKKALAGEMDAVQEIANRLDGRPLQNIESRVDAQLLVHPVASEPLHETESWVRRLVAEHPADAALEPLPAEVTPADPDNFH